jgi:outer membrane receptor protein involved in Fe transport
MTSVTISSPMLKTLRPRLPAVPPFARPVGCLGLALLLAATIHGQEPARQTPAAPGAVELEDDGTVRMRLPTVTVRAEKEPENVQDAAVSVTAVTRQTLEDAGVRSVSDAAQYAPNTYFNEFSARKLSNARFRGIGSSPNNPAITTFIDGVPQLNANSTSPAHGRRGRTG